MRRLLLSLPFILAPIAAFANCAPTPILDGGGVSTNTKTALDGSSNCFGFVGVVDSGGANAFPVAAALADAVSNPTVISLGSYSIGFNGTTWDRLRTVGTGILKTDVSTIAGTATVTGGVSGLQAVGGPVASGGANADNPLKIGGVFNTTQPTVTNGQIVDLQATARGAAIVATGTDTFNVTVNAAIAAGTNVIGKTGIDQTTPGTTNAVQAIPGTAGGMSTCILQSGASNNATNCKASAGQVYLYSPVNTTTTIYYLRMYNLTTAPTCSSATGFIETIPVPPAAATGGAGGIVIPQDVGEPFSTGIAFCLTGGGSSTDNTNAATGVYIRIGYK